MKNFGRFVWVTVVGVSAVACGGLAKDDTTGPQAKGNDQGYVSPADYPAGPYGYKVGSTIADLTFLARRDASMKGNPAEGMTPSNGMPNIGTYPIAQVHLADYRKDYKVLVISASAQWCYYCMEEQPDLKELYQSRNSSSPTVGILEVIVQDNQGRPAGMDIADQWARAYGINFDIGADPTGVLSPYYDINAFPMNMVVKTSDMTIQWEGNGANYTGLKSAVGFTLSKP